MNQVYIDIHGMVVRRPCGVRCVILYTRCVKLRTLASMLRQMCNIAFRKDV